MQFQQQVQQWITLNPRIAPYKAEESLARLWVEQQEMLSQWEENQQQQTTSTQPNIILTTESVNLVLQAWCLSNNGEVAAERAERLLHWMEDLTSSSSNKPWSSFLPTPNYQSYATIIDAWSRAAIHEGKSGSTANNVSMESKSGGRMKSVVSPATKAGFECAKRAEAVLMHMQSMHEAQIDQNGDYNSDIQPDTRVFNLALQAWSNIQGGTKASAIRAMRILDLMQELHHHQSMNASEWQGIVLSKVQPNLRTYKLLLNAWAHATNTVEGPDRAEEILRHLLSLSKAGNMGIEIMPDAECFHIVMRAHAESVRKKGKGGDGCLASVERAQKVTSLLDWMEMLSARDRIKPTTESYRIALTAWVWSHQVDAPKEAERILYRMIRVYDMSNNATSTGSNSNVTKAKKPVVRPDTRDFNTLINCCSFARTVGVGVDKSEESDEELLQRQIAHREIYNIAKGAFNTLMSTKYAKPDSASFAGIIRACVNLLPDTTERDDIVIDYFRLAYRTEPPADDVSPKVVSSTSSERMKAPPGAGCADANVLRQLRHALPSTEDYIRVREEFEQHRRQNEKKIQPTTGI